MRQHGQQPSNAGATPLDTRRPRIDIDAIEITLEAVPGINPTLFARHVELGLSRLRLAAPGASHVIARLAPPPVQAVAGDTAVTLAARVCAGVSQALAAALARDGRRP